MPWLPVVDLDDVAFRVLSAAGFVAASRGKARPNLPTLDELAELARNYLASMDAPGAPRGTLANTGAVFVTTLAARQYQEFESRVMVDINDDTSRREVTRLLLNARAAPSASDTDLWKVRARMLGIELVARVINDGRLRIVSGLTAIDLNTATRST